MTLELVRSLDATAVVGISGHAGCGHAHSHCGFVQDDSGGLAAVLAILQRTTGLDLTITRVTVQTGRKGRFEVETASGGKGSAAARRGITAAEARLAQFVVGRQAICTQALASTAFGRIYGQGAMEVPVALRTAIALAALNSFEINFPDQVLTADEGVTGNCGRILGTKICINGVVASVLAVVNASEGGLGPNEDVEGNVNLGPKKALMDKLGLATMPTLLIEGKVCADPASSMIQSPTFLIRAYPDDDNVVAAQSYVAAADKLGYPSLYLDNLLARSADAMRKLGNSQGENIIRLGEALRDAKTAVENGSHCCGTQRILQSGARRHHLHVRRCASGHGRRGHDPRHLCLPEPLHSTLPTRGGCHSRSVRGRCRQVCQHGSCSRGRSFRTPPRSL